MIKLERKKRRNILLSILNKLQKLIPLNPEKKLKLFLNLTWIFARLSHEQIFKTKILLIQNNENDFLINLIPKNSYVLDIGCGRGHIVNRLIDKTTNIIGIDNDKYSIEIAKKSILNTPIQFFCVDVFKYLKENEDKKFNVIILSHILEHLDNPNKFLFNLADKADYLYVEVPDIEATYLNIYRETLKVDLIYSDADHVTEFDRKSLEMIINEAGLFVLKAEFRYGVIKYWCSKNK